MEFDLVVIGAGPGGYVAAIRAARLGAKTALIEKDELGGTCLNRGCIPTKALLASADKVAEIKHMESFGIKVSGLEIDFPKMVARKNSVVKQLRSGVKYLLQQNKVTIYKGTASFLAGNRVEVVDSESTQQISAKKFIIASGSVPRKLNLAGDTECTLSSDGILDLDKVPANLVVIGGGVIGVEFAAIFNNLGSKVTVVEIMGRILPQLDEEVTGELAKKLKKQGIEVLTSAKVEEIQKTGGTNFVIVSKAGGSKLSVLADKVLVAPGRVPYLDGLNLEAAGVSYSSKGISVSENLLTSNPDIYAIGDVSSGIQLAHLASAQGMVAAEHALGKKSHIVLRYVPSCIYTEPEVASVGSTEEQLKETGKEYKSAKYSLRAHGKALAMGSNEGFIKILYGPKHGEILGVHLFAPRATDLIAEAVLAMRAELTVDELATAIHAHPTLAEGIMEAAHIAHGTPIHTA